MITIRKRWKMYRRGIRLANRLERAGVTGWPLPVEADAARRAAREWAKPFLHLVS